MSSPAATACFIVELYSNLVLEMPGIKTACSHISICNSKQSIFRVQGKKRKKELQHNVDRVHVSMCMDVFCFLFLVTIVTALSSA